MPSREQKGRWVLGGLLGVALIAGAWAKLSTSGLRLESSGVLMTMNLSLDRGLVVTFDSLSR
jgi:hypothetical protein